MAGGVQDRVRAGGSHQPHAEVHGPSQQGSTTSHQVCLHTGPPQGIQVYWLIKAGKVVSILADTHMAVFEPASSAVHVRSCASYKAGFDATFSSPRQVCSDNTRL